MDEAALGIRLHTGRATAVVLSGLGSEARVVDRRRFRLVEKDDHDSVFVYHAAAELGSTLAGRHLTRARTIAEKRARSEMAELLSDLGKDGHHLRVVGLPGPSGRPLPRLEEILSSHLFIHSAEIELYRLALANACAAHGVRAILVPKKDLHATAANATRMSARHLTQCLVALGRTLGPPWARDEKDAALAALIAASDGEPSPIE